MTWVTWENYVQRYEINVAASTRRNEVAKASIDDVDGNMEEALVRDPMERDIWLMCRRMLIPHTAVVSRRSTTMMDLRNGATSMRSGSTLRMRLMSEAKEKNTSLKRMWCAGLLSRVWMLRPVALRTSLWCTMPWMRRSVPTTPEDRWTSVDSRPRSTLATMFPVAIYLHKIDRPRFLLRNRGRDVEHVDNKDTGRMTLYAPKDAARGRRDGKEKERTKERATARKVATKALMVATAQSLEWSTSVLARRSHQTRPTSGWP